MRIKLVIPARLASTRLPSKPLIKISGKTMLQRTYERAVMAVGSSYVHIATDDAKIMEEARKFTENVHLTSTDCLTGTDRVAEFSEIIDADTYINLQGDEPIMPIENIQKIFSAAQSADGAILNGFAKISQHEEYTSRMVPKVVVKENNELMYMSRSPIPGNKDGNFKKAFKQICVYAFPKESMQFLLKNNSKSSMEEIEDIEILRFLEGGWRIKMLELLPNTIAVDTPEDLIRVQAVIDTQGENIETYSV